MACIPAPACKAALAQASRRWPGRRTTSDGICSSPKHQQQNPNSDHDYGLAWDLSHDPEHGVDTYLIADLLRRKGDRRTKYIISHGRIYNPAISPDWRTYVGTNPHDKHLHVSVLAKYRDDTSDWWDRLFTATPAPPSAIDTEESLLMPLGKSVEDDRRAWVRRQCLDFWGREPSAADLDFLSKEVGLKGTDNVLAQIADHSYAQAFRAKRGW